MKKFLFLLLAGMAGTLLAGNYPLTTCVVSGEKLGEMGSPYVFTHEGTEVQLCCPNCKAAFDKDPAKYLGKLKPAPTPAP